MVTLGVTTILIMNSVHTELALGTFRPFDSDYRFAGTLHPNVQAPYCATMALAAASLPVAPERSDVAVVALPARHWLAGAHQIENGLWSVSRRTAGVQFIWRVMAKETFGSDGDTLGRSDDRLGRLAAGLGHQRQAVNIALIGRQEEAGSAMGRVPLWMAIAPHLQEHPLFGHGYQTFWNPGRIEEFSRSF